MIGEARGVKPVTVRNALYSIRASLVLARSRRSWSGPYGTGCWMTDHAGCFRGNGTAPGRPGYLRPMRAKVKVLRRKLGDDADNPTCIFTFTEPRVGYRMPKGE